MNLIQISEYIILYLIYNIVTGDAMSEAMDLMNFNRTPLILKT